MNHCNVSMTVIISRRGVAASLRQLQLGRRAQYDETRRYYNQYYLHPDDNVPPRPPYNGPAFRDSLQHTDGSTADHSTADEFHDLTDTPPVADQQKALLRHQLELRSPVDVLRRRFFGPTAIVRSYWITKQVLQDLTAGKYLKQPDRPQHAVQGDEETEVPGQQDNANNGQAKDHVHGKELSTIEDVLTRQLQACRLPEDVTRVYTIAFRRKATSDALQYMSFDSLRTEPWFVRMQTSPGLPRALGVLLRRYVAKDGALLGHTPELFFAALRAAGRYHKYEALVNLLHMWHKEIDWSKTRFDPAWRQKALSNLFSGLVSGLRTDHTARFALSAAIDPYKRELLREILRAIQLTASSSNSGPKLDSHVIHIDALDILTDRPLLANYLALLGFAGDRERLAALRTAITKHSARESSRESIQMTTCSLGEAFFRIGEPLTAWQILRAADFDLGDSPDTLAAFFGAQDDTLLHSAGLMDGASDEVRRRWEAHRAKHREVLQSYAARSLVPQLLKLEEKLGLCWHKDLQQYSIDWVTRNAYGNRAISDSADIATLEGLLHNALGDQGTAIVRKGEELAEADMRALHQMSEADYATWLETRAERENASIADALERREL